MSRAHRAFAAALLSFGLTAGAAPEPPALEAHVASRLPERHARHRGPKRLATDTVPPEHPAEWPFSIVAARAPVRVHYRAASEEATARQVAVLVDDAWRFNVETLGFRAPPDDHGKMGEDSRYDLYVWRGIKQCWTNIVDPVTSTPWDDWTSFLALDPWGPYGGGALASTITHELNHACQGADDWGEVSTSFEMTATWVEEQLNHARLAEPLADFQARPDWAFDHDDGYDTWYMYGAALFLDFLQERHFGGSQRFVADLWLHCRSPKAGHDDPEKNAPDMFDAFDAILAPHHSSFEAAFLEFERWRWKVGRDGPDGIASHLLAVAGNAPTPTTSAARVASTTVRFRAGASVRFGPKLAVHRPGEVQGGLGPQRLGSRYAVLHRGTGDPARLLLRARLGGGVRWVAQTIPGPNGEPEGAPIDLAHGVVLQVPAQGDLVLIVTAMPEGPHRPGPPDERRHPATLALLPAP